MRIRLNLLFFLIITAMNCFGQEKSAIIKGKIYSLSQTISDIHIINLSNKLGTISNINGEFKIKVKVNDTLALSSIQYELKKVVITKNYLESKKIYIQLIPLVYVLDEVYLHHLTGNLIFDLNSSPKDTIPKHNFNYKLTDLSKILPQETYNSKKPPLYNPFILDGGVSVAATIPDFYYEALMKLKQETSEKKEFPIKIKNELGLDFFIKNLKIPEENIDHFLAYCEYRNIITEYYKYNLLEVIKILQEESEKYNTREN